MSFDAYPAEIVVGRKAEGGWASEKIQRPEGLHVRGYGSPLAWNTHTDTAADLYFLGEEKARVRLVSITCDAGKPRPTHTVHTPGDVVIEAFSLTAAGGQAAVVRSDPVTLSDLYLAATSTLAKPDKRLTNINPQADAWKLPRLCLVSWKGAKGDADEGILELPFDHTPGQKVPLVVAIHGGPTMADYFGLQFWIYGRTLLPAKGYAVLCPNYRGSTGYGDKFLTDLVGNENHLDVEDILKGVDALVEKGIADPERLAVMGWSNGGYLTSCVITKTTRFKAASSGAGIVDTVMEWGANDEPAYAIAFKKGFPWNQSEIYKKTSPTYQLDQIHTPTLIHVGANDERCPPGHSRMLFRALKEYVKVPTELLVYPGEPQGLTQYKHHKAKMEWDLAWFERHVLGKDGK